MIPPGIDTREDVDRAINFIIMILKENYSIKNSLQINSVADYGAEINNLHDLDKLFRFINDKCLNYFILGEGTNLVPPTRYKGLAISHISDEILELDKNTLRVGSSVNWHELVMYANKNYFGFENLSLIPCSVEPKKREFKI